jgi:hypothetical protein
MLGKATRRCSQDSGQGNLSFYREGFLRKLAKVLPFQ